MPRSLPHPTARFPRRRATLALVLLLPLATTAARAAESAAFRRVGHEDSGVDPALRRYTAMVTAVGAADAHGHVHALEARPVGPRAKPPQPGELRGWRLTMLAGKRFASVFAVRSNTSTRIEVEPASGPLDGIAVGDVLVVEEVSMAPKSS